MEVVQREQQRIRLLVEPAQHGVEQRRSPVGSRFPRRRRLEKPPATHALECLSQQPERQQRLHWIPASETDLEVRTRELAALVEDDRLPKPRFADHEQGSPLALARLQ